MDGERIETHDGAADKPVLTRREVMLAAVGALVAGGTMLLNPAAAFATTGMMQFGTTNAAGTSQTELSSSATNGTLRIVSDGTSGYAVIGVIMASSNDSEALRAVTFGTGQAVNAIALGPANTGHAVRAQGGKAQLYLVPATSSGAPTAGDHALGEVFVDSAGIMYRCVAAGTPGTWARMASTVLLPAPVRVIDTRNGTGGITGPLDSLKIRTWNSFLGAAGIPSQAIGLVGNLTMVSVAPAKLNGGGWMAIVPATYANGTTAPANYPGVSTINTPVGTDACANQFTVKLGTGTYAGRISIVTSSGTAKYHAIVDVAGYII